MVPQNFSLVYDWKKLLAALNADFPMLLRASKDGAKVIRGYILTKTASLGEVTRPQTPPNRNQIGRLSSPTVSMLAVVIYSDFKQKIFSI